ncbi:CAP domain-containing protein [Streptomyces sp. NPDC087297]|uniref:CAP domain-containing protein n=1 Tax=Streptomyces sp. NPDC087297 TaxID=3365778 RepID=UPI0037FA5852
MDRVLSLHRRSIVGAAVATTAAIATALVARPVRGGISSASYQLIEISAPGAGAPSFQVALKDLVNGIRSERRIHPVSVDARLSGAAQLHSQEMATMRNLTHIGSDGSTPGQRISRAGYKRRAVGENVAFNQKSPQEVIEVWSNSPRHFENLVNPTFSQVGFGLKDGYWTAVFAAPS